jgi:hypothetical protein
MRDDLDHVPLRTEADVDRYCYRVAGTVGVVMAALLGTTGDPARARRAAAALGMAMQRTNILRDIDEDGGNGRCYVAAEAVGRFGSIEPGRARRSCATRSPAPTPSTTRGSPGSASCAAGAARSRPRPRCTARSCARSSATATGAGPAARSSPAGASS